MIFVVNGLAFASWAARVPAIRDTLGLTPGRVGLLLLAVSAGTMAALPLSGLVVGRLGAGRTVAAGVLAASAGLLVMAVGLAGAAVPAVALGMLAYGVGTSTWDVAMNVEGADVERRLGRTVMPRFHAGFSLGTVLGALVGAGCARAGVPLGGRGSRSPSSRRSGSAAYGRSCRRWWPSRRRPTGPRCWPPGGSRGRC